ncbi:hypothetical protein [Flammeovirga sp. OC4]|uniref:hypothetical protein n=1 Tax=Flammeovirga sp. OC4 TaxID=1382345 RepID=UPI0006939F0A|nr:hypothetical protein [Flammeovirga sp. OC4]
MLSSTPTEHAGSIKPNVPNKINNIKLKMKVVEGLILNSDNADELFVISIQIRMNKQKNR